MIRRGLHLVRHAWNAVATSFWTLVARGRLRLAGAAVGPGLVVNGPILLRLHPSARVSIGRGCRFNSGFRANPVGGHRRLALWIGRDASLEIGDDVGMSNCTIVAQSQIVIGSGTRIGGGAAIYDTDFHSLAAADRLARPDVSVRRAAVHVGERAFVGGHAIVLKGVRLGAESVVGAGSVLTRNTGPGEVWVGNPAVRVRSLT